MKGCRKERKWHILIGIPVPKRTSVSSHTEEEAGKILQISDTAIILTSIEHDEIHQIAKLEISPDSQIIIHLHLSDRHPLKVSSDCIHLALVN